MGVQRRGFLFLNRKKGQYGTYMTFKLLKVLGTLGKMTLNMCSASNARLIAEQAGVSYPRTTGMLKKLKEKGWVKKDRDIFGKKSWMITDAGFEVLVKEVDRKIRIDEKEGGDDRSNAMRGLDAAMAAMKELTALKVGDVAAREIIKHYPIGKIQWALERTRTQMEASNVRKPAAYVTTLIRNGNRNERRIRSYIDKSLVMQDDAIDAVVMNAGRTINPFAAAMKATRVVREGYQGKRPSEITKRDVSEIFYSLHEERKLPKTKS